MEANVISERLALLDTIVLKSGGHAATAREFCGMELVSWLADEPWSDHPQCTCPVLAAFVRAQNDSYPATPEGDAARTAWLRPFVQRLIGTRSTHEVEVKRSLLALDWIVREYTPTWLELVPATAEHAAKLRALPEIVDVDTARATGPVVRGARDAAAAAWDAARAAAGDAAGDAAWAAAGAAAWAAAGAAAWAAAWDAAGAAARAAAGAAARAAAGAAARAAAGDAARAAAGDAAGDAAWAAAGAAAWAAAWAAAGAAAWDAAGAAAWDAAGAAAWDAAGAAARAAAGDAAGDAAGAAAGAAARAAAGDAARAAAGDAAGAAAGDALAPTVERLQTSASVLLGRMIEAR